MSTLDHFVVAGRDLPELTSWFAELTGVEPTAGGSHTGVGTRNALVSLGERTYLELIAVDPDQPEPSRPRPFGVDALGAGDHTLATFGVWPDDIEAAVADLAALDVDLGSVRSMARKTPDGADLAWRLTDTPHPDHGGVFPFLIDWGVTPHPAATSAQGCRLEAVTLHHPQPAKVGAALEVLGLFDSGASKQAIETAERAEPGLSLRLATPKGRVELT